MHLFARKAGEQWVDLEDELDTKANGKRSPVHAQKQKKVFKKRRTAASEERKRKEIEEEFELVVDIEGVVRAFLTGYPEEEGHDRCVVEEARPDGLAVPKRVQQPGLHGGLLHRRLQLYALSRSAQRLTRGAPRCVLTSCPAPTERTVRGRCGARL